MKNVLSTALSAFFVLVAAFIVHRALTFDALTPSTGMAWSAMAQAVAVGILSDIWVAFIGSFCVLIAGIVRLERLIATSLIVSLAFASAAHQAYDEYFRFQIVPFHLTYLLDPDFVKANGRSILNGAVWLNLILIANGFTFHFRWSFTTYWSTYIIYILSKSLYFLLFGIDIV